MIDIVNNVGIVDIVNIAKMMNVVNFVNILKILSHLRALPAGAHHTRSQRSREQRVCVLASTRRATRMCTATILLKR